MAAKVGMLNAILSANTTGFKKGMAEASASANKFATSIKAQSRKLKRFGKQLTKTGKQLSISLSLPLVALGVLATRTFAGFEAEMAKVQAVSGATGKTFSDLRQLAEDLGASTRFTASQVATLQLNYSKLGFVPSDIQKITAATLDLALATGEDLAASAEVAGATLRGFGLTAEQMPKVIDVMALSFSSSALTLEKFKDSMKAVAPVARAVGATLEDTTAVLSTLVDSGLEASTAGTSLRMIFIRLAKNGISWNDAMAKIRGSTNKLKTATELFGDRAAAAGLIIAENEGKITDLTESYEKAGGAAKRMATIMDATLEGAMLKVKSAVEAVGIEFGRRLAPILTVIAEKAVALAGWFKDLDSATKDVVLVVAALVVTVGPLLVALGFLASTILPALLTGFALLTGPIGLVVLGIAALTGAYFLFSKNAEEAATKQELLNDVLIDAKKSVAAEGIELKRLLDIAKEDLLPRKLRLEAIKKINKISPEYLGNIRLENINSQETTNAVLAHKDAILAKAKAQAIYSQIRKLADKQLIFEIEQRKLLTKQIKLLTSGEESFKTSFKDSEKVMTSHGKALKDNKIKLDKIRESLKLTNKEITNYTDLLTEIEGKELNIVQPTQDLSGTGGTGTGKATEELKKYKDAIKAAADEYDKLRDSIVEVDDFGKEDIAAAAAEYDRLSETASTATATIADGWAEMAGKIASTTQQIASVVGEIWGGMTAVFSQNMLNQEIAMQQRHDIEMELLEKKIGRRDIEQKILDQSLKREILRIETSTMSEQERLQAIFKAEKKHGKESDILGNSIAAQRKIVEDKITTEKKKAAKKRAFIDKAEAIFGAIVNTALAITKVLWNPVLAGIVAALGATQIGLIASQPLPALAHGGIVTQPTLALIGEAGPEAVIPLNKGFDMGNQMGGKMELITRITGEDIELILKKVQRRKSFV